MAIFVYPHDCTDFSTTGLCGDLQPIEAHFEEEKNGISQIEMTLHYDKWGKWKEVKVGRYISALVPVRVVPAIDDDSYSTAIQKIKVKSGTSKVYVDKTCQKVLYKSWFSPKEYSHTELHVDPESIMATQLVRAGVAEIVTSGFKGYVYQDDYETIEQVEIPPALDGVEFVTGTARLKPQFFIITSVEQTLEGMIVTAKHVFYELLANATTYKTENTVQGAAACRQVFDNLISADDRFEIYSDCTDEQSALDYDRVSPVQALLDPDEGICAKYGLSLIRDNYSIYALKNVGTDRGFVVEYGKNMLSVDCIENIDETYTRIIPFGKDKKGNAVYMDGQKWVDSSRINDYPAPRVLVLDCTDTASESGDMNLSQVKAELKRRAEEELANGIDKPNLEMTVDFLSLGDTEEYKQYRGLDKVYMFDRITVKDKVRGYNYTAEVVAVRHNLLTGMLESCTIGSLETASAARKIASWQVPTVDGGNIRLQSIVPGILGADAVATDNIQDNAVVAEKINAGAIEADKIKAGAVTAEKVDAGAITAEKIAADAITTDKIAAGAVKADNIDAQAVTAAKLAAGAVTANAIKAGSVTTEKIAAGAVTAESGILAAGVVGTAQIADGSITDAKIVGLTASKITAGTINAAEVNINNLNADNITAGTINGQRIPTLGGEKIADGAISGVKIVNGAIVTDKIANGAVTAAKIVAEAVTTDKLAANAVTANKILSGAVTTDKLSANAVTADKIAANTITANKLASDVGSSLDLSSNQSINLTVKKAVDDIEIGGRNLLKNSKGDFRLYPANTGADGDKFVAWPFYFKTTLGETYTFGADVEITDGDFDTISIYPYPGGTLVNVPIPANGRITHTFTVTVDTITQILAYAGIAGSTRGNGVIFRNVKIEKGNKATDWSPAPEDIEGRVSKAEAEIAVQAGEIALKVNVGDSVETLENSAMTLNADGIEMTTTGHFRLYANDGKNSRIKLGGDNSTANFSVDETGKLGAVSGAFANGLTVGGQGVWTKGNIIISSSQPTNVHDVLWLQPLQGVQQISHNFKPENNTSMVHNQQYPFTLTPVSTDALANGGSYVYTMQIEVARMDDGKGFKNYTFKAVLTTSAGSVTLTSGTISMGSGGNASITMTVQSTTNLFATAGSVEVKISVTAPETGSTGLYIKRGQAINLTSKNTAASSAGAQTCTIHYIQ